MSGNNSINKNIIYETGDVICTEHPYVVKVGGVCGSRPIIKGTRTPVQAVVEYYRMGMNTNEILVHLPYLTESQIHDALSYFHDHKKEILNGIRADHVIIQGHEAKHKQKKMMKASL